LLEKPGIEFDARKFEYIGVPAQDNYAMVVARATGIASAEQWLASRSRIKFGGVGIGSPTDDIVKILAETIGLPVQLVTGYKGTADIRLAFQSGEIQGVCNAWESLKATWRKELESGDATIVLQTTAKPHPDLSNVPLAIGFARTDEARKLIQVGIHTVPFTARPFVLPPGTPKDRVQILRRAFMATMQDPEFLAEAQKAKVDINPLDGAELERYVRDIFNLEPALVAKLKEILR
jgi:tripartite-type tricarboxylate transporter receptor subunit TctC